MDVHAFAERNVDAPRLGAFRRGERRELSEDVCPMLIRQPQRLKIRQPSERIGWNRQWKDMQRGDASVEQVRKRDRFVERVT